jgi:hypothetical protein
MVKTKFYMLSGPHRKRILWECSECSLWIWVKKKNVVFPEEVWLLLTMAKYMLAMHIVIIFWKIPSPTIWVSKATGRPWRHVWQPDRPATQTSCCLDQENCQGRHWSYTWANMAGCTIFSLDKSICTSHWNLAKWLAYLRQATANILLWWGLEIFRMAN